MVFGMAAVQTDMSREGGRIGPHWEVSRLLWCFLLSEGLRKISEGFRPIGVRPGGFWGAVARVFGCGAPSFSKAWGEDRTARFAFFLCIPSLEP